MERYPVNPLFWQLHGVKADAADLVALALHGHVEPILLLHGVALALVVASGVSLLGLLLGGVVKPLAHDDAARRASSGGKRIAIGEFVAQVCAACAEGHVADGARSRATREQAGDEGDEELFGYVGDDLGFLKC